METPVHPASAFRNTWNKTEESHSYRRTYRAGTCRLRFSFFIASDYRSRLFRPSGGAPRGRRMSADGRSALRDFVPRLMTASVVCSARACSSVG